MAEGGIPQPPGWPILGNLFEINPSQAIKSLFRLRDNYGPICKLVIVGITRISVTNHELFDELCDEHRFVKSVSGPVGQMRNGANDGLVTAHPNEENWGVAHRTLLPAFGELHVQDMFDEMYDIASQLILKWARQGSEKPINVIEDATRFTLDSIALSAMGARFNSFYSEDTHPFVTHMLRFLGESNLRANRPAFATKFMWSRERQYWDDIKYLRTFSKQLLRERRQNPTERTDILNAMVNGRDPKTGEKMNEESIIDNMITFLVAGHETTAGAIGFLFYHLLKDPEVWRQVQEEVDQVIGNRRITVEDLSKLRYINSCARETLRLYPTAPVIFFKPIDRVHPTVIGQGRYTIMPRQSVMAVLPAIHKDPEVWGDDVDDFRPDRMSDGKFESLPKNAWKPFGNGSRSCIGRAFAWNEIILITALAAQSFNLKFKDENYELEIDNIVTLRPKNFFMHAVPRPHLDALGIAQNMNGRESSHGGGEVISEKVTTEKAAESTLHPLTILYGSNMGTCETLASYCANAAVRNGFKPSIMTLDSAVGKLPVDQPVVIITASYEGQPADNAANFVSWVQSLREESLSGVKFVLYGCGNRDWVSTFHRIPKLVDGALGNAGAQRLTQLSLADVSSGSISSKFAEWQDCKLWPCLRESFGLQSTKESIGGNYLGLELIATPPPQYTQQHDQQLFDCTVLENSVLTAPGHKEKRHIRLKLPSEIRYSIGDYVNIYPTNPLTTVARAMNRFGISLNTHMKVTSGISTIFSIGKEFSVYESLSKCVELNHPATAENIEAIIERVTSPVEKTRLTKLITSTNLVEERLSVLDILEQAPSAPLSLGEFLQMLQPIRLRQYSISSSPSENPHSCSLTVSVVDRKEDIIAGKRIKGVATNYLSGLEPQHHLSCGIRTTASNSKFKFPDDLQTTSMVMICAGSGIAPFRAFVQERAFRMASSGHKLAPAILFIGCRSAYGDKLFAREFEQWQEAGVVDVRYAYSKEPPEEGIPRQHVQDRLWQDRKDLIEMYDGGARFYLCGSNALRNSVVATARQIFATVVEARGMENTDEIYEHWFAKMNRDRVAVDIFA